MQKVLQGKAKFNGMFLAVWDSESPESMGSEDAWDKKIGDVRIFQQIEHEALRMMFAGSACGF